MFALYDCNTPTKIQKITFYKNNGGYSWFYYPAVYPKDDGEKIDSFSSHISVQYPQDSFIEHFNTALMYNYEFLEETNLSEWPFIGYMLSF